MRLAEENTNLTIENSATIDPAADGLTAPRVTDGQR